MYPFDIEALLLPGAVILLATLAVAFLATRSPIFSILAALAKATLFLVYFGAVFDGTYTFLDDWTYIEGGENLNFNELGITDLTSEGDYILMVAKGSHFLYYLYNAYAFQLFGDGYYAPVALNILATLAVAHLGARLAVRELSISKAEGRVLFGFLLLHPDILAWSNVFNGKDILVLLMHVLLLSAVAWLFAGRIKRAVVIAGPAVTALLFLRFYVPLAFASALCVRLLPQLARPKRVPFLLLALVVAAGAFFGLGDLRELALNVLREHFVNPAYGFVRILLTPIPFNTSTEYAFLNVPALLHWLLLPALFTGAVIAWREKTLFSRFLVVYLVLFLGLYASFDELQGPRHRVQLDYAIALFQFLGLRAFWQHLRVALHSSVTSAS